MCYFITVWRKGAIKKLSDWRMTDVLNIVFCKNRSGMFKESESKSQRVCLNILSALLNPTPWLSWNICPLESQLSFTAAVKKCFHPWANEFRLTTASWKRKHARLSKLRIIVSLLMEKQFLNCFLLLWYCVYQVALKVFLKRAILIKTSWIH